MAKPARIRTFDDVETTQQFNDYRLDRISSAMNKLIETVEKTSRRVDATTKSVAELRVTMAEFKVEMAEHRKSEEDRSKERDRRSKERDRRSKEMDRRSKELDKRIKDLGKQIGYVHNSHGEFVEHMASGSIKNIVENQFKAKYRGSFLYSVDKTTLEIDAWGTRGRAADTEVFVFEIKKKFNRKAVKQLRKQIATLRSIEPSYSTCPIYPFIASAVISEQDAKWVWDHGIYLLKFSNKIFEFGDAPKGFRPDYKIGIPPPKGPRRIERMVPPPPPRFVREQMRLYTEE